MLSYDDALDRILERVPNPLPVEAVPIESARGRALAVDVLAESAVPPFDNSAVDGYAVWIADTRGASAATPVTLPVSQEIAAGYAPSGPLAPGTAARILTGAMVPDGADGIVMVEDTRAVAEGSVEILEAGAARFVRRAGSDLERGSRALARGAVIGAGEIGLLASLDHATVPCARRPRIGLLTTGDELVPVGGAALGPGQIRDSNGPALAAAVEEAGGVVALRRHARDTRAQIEAACDAFAAAGCDLILSSGGVSVGVYDLVRDVLEARGTLDFWRIAIKPGKPLAFGTLDGTLFFGLPGNPVSSLVTFELFVRPVLRRLAGHADPLRPRVDAVLTSDLPHESGRREFVRARLVWADGAWRATPTGAQGSHRLASMVGAQALLVASEHDGDLPAGARLTAFVLI